MLCKKRFRVAQQGGQEERADGWMTWHVSQDPGPYFWFLVVFRRVVDVSSGTSNDLVLRDYSI